MRLGGEFERRMQGECSSVLPPGFPSWSSSSLLFSAGGAEAGHHAVPGRDVPEEADERSDGDRHLQEMSPDVSEQGTRQQERTDGRDV